MRHELFSSDELEPGQLKAVEVDGISIVVIRTPDGDLYALRNVCAHHGAKLQYGRVQQAVRADRVGEYKLSDEYVIRCPWHGFEYDVTNGRSLADPNHCRVRAYAVTVEDGTVVLER